MKGRYPVMILAAVGGLAPWTAAVPNQALDPADFVAAARRGDEHAVRTALEEDPDLVNAQDAMGMTALDWAATREHWFIFRQLLAAGADVKVVGFDGGTVLHRLAHHDQPELASLLLRAGADPDFLGHAAG